MDTQTISLKDRAVSAIKYWALRFFERFGAIKPTLVAISDYDVTWLDDDIDDEDEDEVDDFGTVETITFYLLEYPSGQRDYRVHEYGKNYDEAKNEEFLSDILIWVLGGPLPPGSVKIGEPAEIIPFGKVDETEDSEGSDDE